MGTSLLLAPVHGLLRGGLCIDEEKTKVREDFIRVTKNYRTTQIDVGCVLPPRDAVTHQQVFAGLCKRLKSTSKKEDFNFLSRFERLHFSLQEIEPRDVLVITYLYDKYDGFIYENLHLAQAKIHTKTYEEYSLQPECLSTLTTLIDILISKNQKLFLERLLKSIDRADLELSRYLTVLAIKLFNTTCQESIRRWRLLALECPTFTGKDNYFRFNNEYTAFNRVLRDPMVFVNTMNLVSFLSQKEMPYSKKVLLENLPRSSLPFLKVE